MSKRRVVITGLGQVSPIGNDIASAWQSLIAGKSGIAPITRFDASTLTTHIAGEVKQFDVTQYLPAKDARRMDIFLYYGVAAALQAIDDAGLDDVPNLDKNRVGVSIGSGIGGLPSIESTT
ncbi:MAG: beta-ketoacyl-ACP synthase II, partial [Neisseriaceae bacterium]|nr:beta-ketoacyl-ACP synthase II [Neisseriaceae bacterium]